MSSGFLSSSAQWMSAAFAAALVLTTGIRLWLARRQVAHILAHRDSVPAEFASRVSLSAHQRAADYSIAKTRLAMVHAVVEALFLAALTFGGVLDAFDHWLAQVVEGELARGSLFVVGVMLLTTLIELPFTAYRTFVIDARFGFNRTTPGLFIADLVKGALVMLLLGLPLVLGVLWLMVRMGNGWWLGAWLTWMGFNLLVLFLYPTVIAPLFNRFTPLPEGELKRRIEALLTRCGFRAGGLFVMDGSRRSSHGNAYFTGFGRARRVVFYDTLIDKLEADEVEAVLAHELGHFKRRHVQKRLVWTAVVSLAALWLASRLIDTEWFFEGLGASTPSAHMGLVLFVLVGPVFAFPLAPLASLFSRRHEFEADAFAARIASGEALMRALLKLYQDNAATLTPDPLYSTFYDTHPPAALRIGRLKAATA